MILVTKTSDQTRQRGPCMYVCMYVPGMRIWSCDMGSAVPSRVSLLISILKLNLVYVYVCMYVDYADYVYVYAVYVCM